MKYTLLFSVFLFVCFTSFSQEEKEMKSPEITTYYLIRHAEKDRSNSSEENPHLKEKGLERAQNWSHILGNIKFDAVYSTNCLRTKETVQPTADKNKLELTLYDPNTVDVASFKDDTMGKTVLVVGHSNTIPDFVNAIIGQKKYENIDDANNGNLYMVTLINGKVADQVLTIN